MRDSVSGISSSKLLSSVENRGNVIGIRNVETKESDRIGWFQFPEIQ